MIFADRFAVDLAALIGPGERVGIAVSGGPDSLALLLLAAHSRPGLIEAATVDHRLRPESATEAEQVATICGALGVPHQTLRARWDPPPTANLQARARDERYALLSIWAEKHELAAVATAHHADDQAETLLMRLSRGSGIGGLSGARRSRALTGNARLVRPLLTWRKAELSDIINTSGLAAIDDPANFDHRHDRARVRRFLDGQDWLDPARLAASAAHLREASDALDWVTAQLVRERMVARGDALEIDSSGLPQELKRRLLLVLFDRLGGPIPRGPDLAAALERLSTGATITLGGVKVMSGPLWRASVAPPRRHQREQPS